MPHKRNPITCEQVSGLARLLRANAHAAMENMPLWHERDISHSSIERVLLPDSTTLTHHLTYKLNRVMAGLDVNEKRMRSNIDLTGGLYNSGTLLLALVRKGVLREEAYVWVQRNAMVVWEKGGDYEELVKADPDISRYLTRDEIEEVFRLETKFRHIDTVYERVFGTSGE